MPTPPAGVLDSAEAMRAGALLFARHCALCHGADASGRGVRQEGFNPPPANLTLGPWNQRAAAGRTFLAIKNGVPGTAMPPWAELGDDAIWQIVAFLDADPAKAQR